jgi:hypothetical protein
MGLATFWAIFFKTNLVTLVSKGPFFLGETFRSVTFFYFLGFSSQWFLYLLYSDRAPFLSVCL